jgi:protein-L-isoaspartate(D-aspartate) O-methyltransferase
MSEFADARRNMVDGQIVPNRVTDRRLIEALSDLPRERFVPKAMQGVAYVDEDLSVAAGRYLMEPMVFARLVQEAGIQPGDVVLDIGAGTGYEAAVMARLASVVVAVEENPDLAKVAGETLGALAIDNVVIMEGPLNEGCTRQGPYDVVFFGGAVEEVPPAILKQLADGGRLVAVVNRRNIGSATLITRQNGVLGDRVLFDAGTPLLPGFARKPEFQF